MAKLNGLTAIVCGGTAGIGLAIARALIKEGVRQMVIVGRDPEKGEIARKRLADESPQADVRLVSVDVSHPRGAVLVVESCMLFFGRIDTLVSGAAGDPMPRLLHETAVEDLPEIFRSIICGVTLPLRAALPYMTASGGGSMTCIASDAAKLATPGEAAIGGSMAAIAMFCRSLALESRRHQIRVNCVTPSIVRNTQLYEKVMNDPFASRLFEKAQERAYLGVVEPQDLAELVCFLASPSALRLTGQTISVTGGISAA
jgi:NAD(P)-dependent dehydrogenase (short-subunit alcohol dehydrogenase family)